MIETKDTHTACWSMGYLFNGHYLNWFLNTYLLNISCLMNETISTGMCTFLFCCCCVILFAANVLPCLVVHIHNPEAASGSRCLGEHSCGLPGWSWGCRASPGRSQSWCRRLSLSRSVTHPPGWSNRHSIRMGFCTIRHEFLNSKSVSPTWLEFMF